MSRLREWPDDNRHWRTALVAVVVACSIFPLVGWCSVAPLPSGVGVGVASSQDLPLPPAGLHRAAAKALRGEFGPLQPWQEKAWRAVVRGHVARHQCWLTHYGPPHHPHGDRTRWGYRCSESTIAANKLPPHSLVILELPRGYEVRRVEDMGAKSNDRRARRHGAAFWCDRWHPRPQGAYNIRIWRMK